jgi:hypothetical protein
MSALLELQERLEEVGAAIGRLEPALAEERSPSLVANLHSLQNYRLRLEQEFIEEANERGQDVCSYRLFSENFRPTASALASALGGFQRALSVSFQALKNGPKDTVSVTKETVRDTELGIAYTFPGSFGVVMTLRNDVLLLEQPTILDEAIDTVFSIAKAEDPAALARIAKSVGHAPVRAMFKWASGHASSKTGADIDWRRGEQIRNTLVRQYPQIQALHDAIEDTSDEQVQIIDVVGTLVGADLYTRRFHFVSEAENMKGVFRDAISESQTATLPSRYYAKIQRTTKTRLSTEKQELSYFLLKLAPVLT